jgi:putative transposase
MSLVKLSNNALGKPIQLLTSHALYLRLGKTEQGRQSAYRSLLRGRLPERSLSEIRETTDKGWVLGEDRFKAQVEVKTDRWAAPFERGGDRKSAKYREANS